MTPYNGKLDILENVLGALVVEPKPGLYGHFNDNEAIVSVDFSSLYPTIMTLYNIGFETLRAKIYDWYAVGSLITMLEKFDKNKSHKYITVFNDQIDTLIRNYVSNNVTKDKKKSEVYNIKKNIERFERVVKYLERNNFESLIKPKDNASYQIFIECLFPLMEVFSRIHPRAPKNYCIETTTDYVFRNDKFEEEYGSTRFVLIDNIHSTKREMKLLDYNEIVESYFKKFILTPSGALYYKHSDKLGYLTKHIVGMQRDRKKIQRTGENLEILKETEEIDENEIIVKINQKEFKKLKQFFPDLDYEVLEGFDFKGYIFKSLKDVSLLAKSYDMTQLVLKIKLNSLYGISGLKSFYRASPLIANSITIGARITGIVLAGEIIDIEEITERVIT